MKRGWTIGLIGLLWVMGVGAQEPRPFPLSTAEPPLAAPEGGITNDPRPDSTSRPLSIVPIPQGEMTPPSAPPVRQPMRMVEPSPIQPAQFTTPQQPLPNGRMDENYFPPTPIVQMRLSAPSTTANGQEVVYRLIVENRSQGAANHVKVRVPMLADAPLTKATPEPTSRDKELVWEIGTLEPGAKRDLTIALTPTAAATEIKMCARVSFEHGQCVVTKLAKPVLEMRQLGSEEGILFDPLVHQIEITNPGSVEVQQVKLTKTLSDGLEFERLAVTPTANSGILDIQTNPLATERTWMLGNLRAGQKRVIEFRVMPKKTGQFNVKTSLVAAGSVKEEKVGKWSILEPKLGLKITGPETAYVGQPATYQVAVNNLGTATLNNVRVSVPIPQASETVRMSNEGQVFRDQVQWIVAKLEPGDSRTLSVTFKTPRPGPRRISATVRADRGLEQRAEIETRIEGVAALNWKTEGTPATTKAGMDIVYTIRVTNTGSAPATNVVVKGEYPVSVEYRAAQPQASLGKGIVSYPAQTIPAGQTATYTLTVTAVKADQARFVFTLFADHLDKNNPIRSEPTTTISGP